ncbi:MAG: nuclear transport factor 2 family protein [Actinobacteria bacterium]|nr:MAG: nuclear transport factor 2 family protein [Actinomycetota bacterium]
MSVNVDLVRSIYAAWERGDFSSADWADPEIEYVVADGTEPGVWKGIPAMSATWRETLRVWEDVHTEVDEYRELDDERVFALLSWSGRGRTSGFDLADVPWRGANVVHIRDGKVTRLVLYWDRERALADLGLDSEAAPP